MSIIRKAIKKYNTIPLPAKAALWFIFCSVLQKSISLLTTPIFTRLMSTTQYGQFNIYNSWLQIFTIITTLRLNYAVFNKGMSKYKDDRDSYTSTMQTLTFILTGVTFVIYLIFREQINAIIELPTFVMIAIFLELFVTPAIDFWTIRKRYEYIYKPVVTRTLLMILLNTVLGILAVVLADEKGYARILSCVLVNLIFGVILFTYNIKKSRKIFVWEYAKFALLFNIPLLLHYISQYILDQFDRIMIQKMVGFAAAGIYGVAYNAGMLMKIVTVNLNNAMVPWQYDKLEKRKFKDIDDTTFMMFILVAGLCLVFTAFAPEIMMVLADEKYQEAVYAIPPVALGTFFLYVYTTFANVEFFFNQTKFTMFISMGGAALNIGLNYIGIKMFGYIAAAYTTLICYVVFSLAHYFYMCYGIKKALGLTKVFKTSRLLILFSVVLLSGLLVIAVYDKIIIRYAIMLVILVAAIIKRKTIISLLKSIKKPKKEQTPDSQ